MTDQLHRPKPLIVVREGHADHSLDGAVVAIGNFDGVHRGHRAVIAAALARAKALTRPAAALAGIFAAAGVIPKAVMRHLSW